MLNTYGPSLMNPDRRNSQYDTLGDSKYGDVSNILNDGITEGSFLGNSDFDSKEYVSLDTTQRSNKMNIQSPAKGTEEHVLEYALPEFVNDISREEFCRTDRREDEDKASGVEHIHNLSMDDIGRDTFSSYWSQLSPQDLTSYLKQTLKEQQRGSSKQRRPCDLCRKKKIKCTLIPNTETCVSCSSKSLRCTYVGQPTKRKNYSSLEYGTKRQRHSMEIPNNPAGSSHNVDSNITPPNVPIRETDPVIDYSVISDSLLKKTLSLQFPRSSFFVGPNSYLYDLQVLDSIIRSQETERKHTNTRPRKVDQVDLSDTMSARRVSDQVHFILKDDQPMELYEIIYRDVDSIEKFAAPHGRNLIDLYFRTVHPSYPILHKKVFLEKYERTHREFSAPLLAAVYVLAIQWWEYDSNLNRSPKPNVEQILKIGLRSFMLEISKRPKLSAVQAGLLFLQCKNIVHTSSTHSSYVKTFMSSESSTTIEDSKYSDWILCCQVVALSEELGLGLDCRRWKLPEWERGLRKRLAWAVYMEDKWLSLKNARPSHITENNWAVSPLVDEDFPEKHGDGDLEEGSMDIDKGKLIFINMINLSIILSDILNQFYSLKAMNDNPDISSILQKAKPLQLRLREWYHSLPEEVQMSSVQPRKLSSNGYLQLAYFAAELTLHRKIISVIYQRNRSYNDCLDDVVEICRSAAQARLLAAIEFVRDLKLEHIHSFWPSSSSSNFTLIGTFALLLYVSSRTSEEANFFKDQIFNYRWVLKITSKGFDLAYEALLNLEITCNRIPIFSNNKGGLSLHPPAELSESAHTVSSGQLDSNPSDSNPIEELDLAVDDGDKILSAGSPLAHSEKTSDDKRNYLLQPSKEQFFSDSNESRGKQDLGKEVQSRSQN